jgi:hypothetical protein
MNMMGIATTLATGLFGLLLGAGVAWRIIGARAKVRHARLVAAAREQLATSSQGLRAINARLQADLEKEKVASQQRQMAFVVEQRSSVTRLEGQLRFAYAEIDRLNAGGRGRAGELAGSATDHEGFALTRPFER